MRQYGNHPDCRCAFVGATLRCAFLDPSPSGARVRLLDGGDGREVPGPAIPRPVAGAERAARRRWQQPDASLLIATES
jgi:hypothetical protein